MKRHARMPYWLIIFLVFLLCSVISLNFIQFALVEGRSMEPTYHNGQLVLINKMPNEYHSGDIVIFYCDELDSYLIKRIVACPRDSLIISNSKLCVNNEFISGYSGISSAGIAEHRITLKDGCFFLMGDNHEESIDSRDVRVGQVCLSNIKGKVIQR